ncbi:MAG: hypothetical protein WC406_08240 [Methanoregula sp.]
MSKYFVEPINPKPAPTFSERAEAAIRDLEKRVDAIEELHRVNSHLSPEAKAELFAMQIMKNNGATK